MRLVSLSQAAMDALKKVPGMSDAKARMAQMRFVEGLNFSEMGRSVGVSPQRSRVIAQAVEDLFWSSELGLPGESAEFQVEIQAPRQLALELEYLNRWLSDMDGEHRLEASIELAKLLRKHMPKHMTKKCPAGAGHEDHHQPVSENTRSMYEQE